MPLIPWRKFWLLLLLFTVHSPLATAQLIPSGNVPIKIDWTRVGGTAVSAANVVDPGNSAFRVFCVSGCAGPLTVNQGTSPWVISGSISNTTFGATQGTSPWVISGAVTTSGTATVSGTVAVTQSTSPWVVSAGSLPLPSGASTSALQGAGLPAALGAGGGVKVDGSGTALPVSGTVTANISGSISNTTFGATQGTSPWVVGQATGTNLHTVVDSGSISTTQGTSPWVVSGTVNTTSDAVVNAANSSTTPLGIGGVFLGTSVDMLGYSTIRVSVFSNVASAAGGWQVQFSQDNSNWDFVRSTTYNVTGTGGYVVFNRIARYARVQYTNGGTGQASFRLQTLLVPNSSEFTRHFLSEIPDGDDGGILTQSVIVGVTTAGGGGYVPVKVAPSGALTTATTLDAETTKVIGTVRTLGNVGGVLDAAIGAAPPANGTPSPGLGSGATGGFLKNITVCDSFANVDIATATTTLIVTGVAARHVRICSMSLVTAAANNVNLLSGTGATCGTGTTGMAGGTTAATGWNFAANGGLTQGSGIGVINQTNATGDSVCIITSGTTQLSGRLSYAIY